MNKKPLDLDACKNAFVDILVELMGDNTVEQFAKLLNIPNRTIRNRLKKVSWPRRKHVMLIADKFNCSIDFLFGLEQ